MAKKEPTTKKQNAEFKLFDALQKKHGYTLREVPKGQRVTMCFTADKKVVPMRICQLAVPMDSALGKALDNFHEDITTTKKTKPAKAKR